MRANRVLHVVDAHTEGMPARIVVGGFPVVAGETMAARRRDLEARWDGVRRLLMWEPRGGAAMSGAVLQPALDPAADVGVLFIEATGCLPMCGHSAIAVATVLVETGVVAPTPPRTTIVLDTPAGLVEAQVETGEDGEARSATIRNVDSFMVGLDRAIEVAGFGSVRYDIGYGGNFYALVNALEHEVDISASNSSALIDLGASVMAAINATQPPSHPEPGVVEPGCRHVVFYVDDEDGRSARNAVSIYPGWIDRSPCGTGTSTRLAQLHARGRLGVGEEFVNESPLGTRFFARIVGESEVQGVPAVTPEIRGRAWIMATGQHLLAPTDPFPEGFWLGGAAGGGGAAG